MRYVVHQHVRGSVLRFAIEDGKFSSSRCFYVWGVTLMCAEATTVLACVDISLSRAKLLDKVRRSGRAGGTGAPAWNDTGTQASVVSAVPLTTKSSVNSTPVTRTRCISRAPDLAQSLVAVSRHIGNESSTTSRSDTQNNAGLGSGGDIPLELQFREQVSRDLLSTSSTHSISALCAVTSSNRIADRVLCHRFHAVKTRTLIFQYIQRL